VQTTINLKPELINPEYFHHPVNGKTEREAKGWELTGLSTNPPFREPKMFLPTDLTVLNQPGIIPIQIWFLEIQMSVVSVRVLFQQFLVRRKS
jgi:hypothetical protein